MAVIRYPYNRRPRPEFCEVPLDVTDRSAGTILVKLADIPREKYAYLEHALSQAKLGFARVTRERLVALRAVNGEMEGSAESEIFRALAVVQNLEKIKPAVKRLLKRTLEDLARKVGEAQASEEDAWMAALREHCVSGGLFGQRVLAVAEAMRDAQHDAAEQLVEAAFVSPMSEVIRSMRVARGELIKHGVTDHKDLFGAITLDDDSPLLDDKGQPQIEPIPFIGSAWSWGGKKKPGCSADTLSLYEDISEQGGCLYAISEAVLCWNKGIVPTPELIWSEWETAMGKKNQLADPPVEEKEEAPIDRDGDAPPENVVPFDAGA